MPVADILVRYFDRRDIRLKPVSGGDINDAFEVRTADARYFVKHNKTPDSYDMFRKEAKGLGLLAEKGKVSTPEVIGYFEDEGHAFLILEWVEKLKNVPRQMEPFWEHLAILHRATQDSFGLDHNNFIGTLPQKNDLTDKWLDFYYQNRVDLQLGMAINAGWLNKSYHTRVERMFKMMDSAIPCEKPSLVHGDLWAGNLIFDVSGKPVFIDPAVYYGNREMDLAMMSLFGGFGGFREFEIYNSAFPIDKNWKDRVSFYQLYYILVHVNLFGAAYVSQADRIINYYGSRTS